jgi:hypothetical protein
VTVDSRSQADRLRLFLAELGVLREQYGFEIGGCGECGSPWVRDLDEPAAPPNTVRLPSNGQVGLFLAWDGEQYVFRQGSVLGGED